MIVNYSVSLRNFLLYNENIREGDMGITDYHAKYFAHDLVKLGNDGLQRISQSLFNSSVDLNPHQVEGALFALRSPISNGVLLADEVGLGKTIEAGLVLCQYWAERKRKLLVIAPASLRKQWQVELTEKFNLPAFALDAKLYNSAVKCGNPNPFLDKQIIIISYNFAAKCADKIKEIQWDLVVIDEAHKLRNSHRESNKTGQAIRWALEDRRKILLTATPLQNSLSELYGIATVIDDKLFGDFPTFRTLYANSDGDLADLKNRISSFTNRTLRKDVLEFIKYTERKLVTIKFKPTDEEHGLYTAVSEFLQRENSYALPQKQKHLTIVVVRKVLASSPAALAGTLKVIKERLVKLKEGQPDNNNGIIDRLLSEQDIDEELLEELMEDAEQSVISDTPKQFDLNALDEEIKDIDRFILWANSLGINTKTRHLLEALRIGYSKMKEMGASEKAVIFTESRRTMEYLKSFLEANGYLGQVVTFSGSNKDPHATQIYNDWLEENKYSGASSGSKAIDLRHAIVDYFKSSAKIMIATEAAAEGINLQFCSLLINFDLPWNPQRIEQRIGRVHRYGQKHDVVVINFLNERNAVEQRIYDLLLHKFNLFEGLFGVSDEILGRLDSAVSFEKKIIELMQSCRTEQEIEASFKKLQIELDAEIQMKLEGTKKVLLEHFDENVHARLRVDYNEALKTLDDVGKKFWRLTKGILKDGAEFNEEDLSFILFDSLNHDIPKGKYILISKDGTPENGYVYRLSHPLGEYCINTALSLQLPQSFLEFDLSGYASRVFALEKYQNQSGWLTLNKLTLTGIEKEEYLLFSGFTESGEHIPADILEILFKLDARLIENVNADGGIISLLSANAERYAEATKKRSLETNNKFFQERTEQLYRWSDDVVAAAERELSLVKAELRAVNREASLAETLEEQKAAQEKIRQVEKRKRAARRRIFEVDDEISKKRDELISALEKKMVQNSSLGNLFIIKWKIV